MLSGILTDIEGTTSSLSFVRETLFPYARAALARFVGAHAEVQAIRALLEETRHRAGLPADAPDEVLVTVLERWIDEDQKIAPLKALQGHLWRQGYEQGVFQGHVYADAARALRDWHGLGVPLYVFSSGSVDAQRLLFRYSCLGDLEPLFAGFFDTRTGAKRDPGAYRAISAQTRIPAAGFLYLSDIEEELVAARSAGFQTLLIDRERPCAPAPGARVARSFSEVRW